MFVETDVKESDKSDFDAFFSSHVSPLPIFERNRPWLSPTKANDAGLKLLIGKEDTRPDDILCVAALPVPLLLHTDES
jgi:hypothetical protein